MLKKDEIQAILYQTMEKISNDIFSKTNYLYLVEAQITEIDSLGNCYIFTFQGEEYTGFSITGEVYSVGDLVYVLFSNTKNIKKMIMSKTKNYSNNNIRTVATNAYSTALSAKSDAEEALSEISKVAKDGYINSTEKIIVKQMYEDIQSEYTSYKNEIDLYGGEENEDLYPDFSSYEKKYALLSSYLDILLEDMLVSSEIDATEFTEKFEEYYEARETLQLAIYSYIKSASDAVADQSAQNEETLTEIADDNKITASEKLSLKTEWEVIQVEYPTLVAQATYYGLLITSYTEKYEAVSTAVTSVLADMTTTSEIDGESFRQLFVDYYSEAQLLLKSITDYSKDGLESLTEELNAEEQARIDAIAALNAQTSELQKQVDGEISNWFYEGEPTLENIPAVDWVTDEEKTRHIGDTYTDITPATLVSEDKEEDTEAVLSDEVIEPEEGVVSTSGQSWRFVYLDGVFSWLKIADSDAVLALQEAANALSVADGKTTTYLEKPSTYSLGDMWILEADYEPFIAGDLLVALSGNTEFEITDWSKKVNYVDADGLADANATLKEEIEEEIVVLEQNTLSYISSNYYDVYGTEELINTVESSIIATIEGVTFSLTSTGGNNLLRDSVGLYDDGNWLEDFEKSDVEELLELNLYNSGINILYELGQNISTPIGTYRLTFDYYCGAASATSAVVINGLIFDLSSEVGISSFDSGPFEIDGSVLLIAFITDVPDGLHITNTMLNQGAEAQVWSLNPNESYSDTVQIGKGIRIGSTGSDVTFVANADIIGFENSEGDMVATFEDDGIEVDNITVTNQAFIGGLLIQQSNGQAIFNYIGEKE